MVRSFLENGRKDYAQHDPKKGQVRHKGHRAAAASWMRGDPDRACVQIPANITNATAIASRKRVSTIRMAP